MASRVLGPAVSETDNRSQYGTMTPNARASQQQQDARTAAPQNVPILPRAAGAEVNHRSAAGVTASPPPSQARQRVRRACFECRTKKVKCNGADPCARCASYRITCEYVEFTTTTTNPPRASGALADSIQVERLESRVASMEQMFKQFLDQFQQMQKNGNDAPENIRHNHDEDDDAAPRARDASIAVNGAAEVIQVTEAVAIERPASRPRKPYPDPNISKIQQLLDAAEADAARQNRASGDPAYDGHSGNTAHCHMDETNHGEEECAEAQQGQATGSGRCYADGFGELDADTHGELRYVGLGSTASVAVENCIGLRRYITLGLQRKGYDSEEPFFTSPEATHVEDVVDSPMAPREPPSTASSAGLPPPPLVDALIGVYTQELAHLFPIASESLVRAAYDALLASPSSSSSSDWDSGYAAVFFALLALAAPLLPEDHAVFAHIDPKWRSVHIGASFYNQSMHFVNLPLNSKAARKGRGLDIVTALGLLSMYLAETGSQAEAWISVGRAIRIAQDIGLHRSPERLRLPKEQWNRRRYTWWCLYILEKQLCTALGRPQSIDDQDCDTEVPSSAEGPGGSELAGFTSLIHLHRIIGTILKIVNSVRNADSWRSAADNGKKDELRRRVREANEALQTWAKDMVPTHIKTARSGIALAQKHVALSSFFSAVMLLHRVFIRNPHRPSPLAGSQAQLKSAKAATDCIRGTAQFIQCVPKSHFLVFHGQYVFVSALILLSCIRWSDDPKFVYSALKDVELAMEALQGLEGSWKGAKKCHSTVEEYLDFTFHVLQGDRKCHFDCEYGYQPHDTRQCRSAAVTTTTNTNGKRAASPSDLAAETEPPNIRGGGVAGAAAAAVRRSEPAYQQLQATDPAQREHLAASGPRRHKRKRSDPSHMVNTMYNGHGHSHGHGHGHGNGTHHGVEQHVLQPVAQSFEPDIPAGIPNVFGDTYFDDTIGNFLGAINPGFEFQEDHFRMFPELDTNPSSMAFLSPGDEGNFLQSTFF
ncbi:fungal-specific transcription factor domain-containing protein [Xylariales sp. PMI_506]|nr:fungal-specific transcription factor domain-containing protein [Xylariales sp. PMI_506]